MSIESYTAERLRAYDTQIGNPFSDDVVERVAEAAGIQHSHGRDFDGLLDAAGVWLEEPFEAPNGHMQDVVDIRRPEEDGTLAYYLPMANPLDTNQRYALATIALANPHTRIIAMGNRSGGAFDSGALSRAQRKKVAHGYFKPLVEPMISYLSQQDMYVVHHAGYSFGADLAAEAAASREFAVATLTAIEPVVGARSANKLREDFQSTEEALAGYVDATRLDGFVAAREHAVTKAQYARGLVRLTNIAIARGLLAGEFDKRLHTALTEQLDGMTATVAWGSRSELASFDNIDHWLVERERQRLNELGMSMGALAAGLMRFAEQSSRVQQWRFRAQRHAMGNDIHLQAAIISQGMQPAT